MTWMEKLYIAKSLGCNCNGPKKKFKTGQCDRKVTAIWGWFRSQVRLYEKGQLDLNKAEILERNFEIIKTVGKSESLKLNWDSAYELANNYYEENGHLLVPVDYMVNGYNLGSWIIRQRVAYKGYYLKKEYVDRLNSIRMIWDKKENINMLKIICNKYQINFENNLPNINYLPYALFEHIINDCIDNNIAYIDSNGYLLDIVFTPYVENMLDIDNEDNYSYMLVRKK